jgi:hypothetical protein
MAGARGVRASVICLITGCLFLTVWGGAAIGAARLGRDGLWPLAWFSAFTSGTFFGLSMVKDDA